LPKGEASVERQKANLALARHNLKRIENDLSVSRARPEDLPFPAGPATQTRATGLGTGPV
jgi:hypothetical protein